MHFIPPTYQCIATIHNTVDRGSNTDGSLTMAVSNSFLSILENHIAADLG